MRGMSAISEAEGTTSSLEWMVHRLMLARAGGDACIFVKAKFNPLKFKVVVSSKDGAEEATE